MSNIIRNTMKSDYISELRDGKFQYSRLQICQIESINTRTGEILVKIPQLSETRRCHVKIDGFTADGFRSSWFRTVPKVGSTVLVFFDHQNNGFILSSSMFSLDSDDQVNNPVNKLYYTLTRLREEGDNSYNDWRELRQGEIDARSSGGCYLHMSDNGILSLISGKTIFKINKNRNELSVDADTLRSSSSFSEFRFGEVKRKATATDIRDNPVSDTVSNHEMSYRLFTRSVSQETSPVLASSRIGNVWDWDSPVPSVSGEGFPLRIKNESYLASSPGENPTYSFEVDAVGNVSMNTSQVNTTFSVSTGSTVMNNSLNFEINASGQVTQTSGTAYNVNAGTSYDVTASVSASIRAPTVSLGASPDSGVVLGVGLQSQLTAVATTFTAAQQSLLSATVGTPPQNAAAIAQIIAAIAQQTQAMNTLALSIVSPTVTSLTVKASQ